MALVDELVSGWSSHFASADRELTWLDVEREHSMWLAPRVLLVGIVDAIGRTGDGDLFFGEWKTASGFDRKTWKQTWRLNVQSLTYGVLVRDLYPECHRFTVRKAFKRPVSFDHAWFDYADAELDHWKATLLEVAGEIHAYDDAVIHQERDGKRPWPTNFDACFRYGPAYACPFFEGGCSQQQFDYVPAGAVKRESHLATERDLLSKPLDSEGVIVLDATRVRTWFDCRERFRKQYVENVVEVAGEALLLGSEFHKQLAERYRGLQGESNG
jgi:hypothetical protein